MTTIYFLPRNLIAISFFFLFEILNLLLLWFIPHIPYEADHAFRDDLISRCLVQLIDVRSIVFIKGYTTIIIHWH